MAKDGHDRAVEIEDESGAPFGLMNKMLQQSIVDTVQLLPKNRLVPAAKIGAEFADPGSSVSQ